MSKAKCVGSNPTVPAKLLNIMLEVNDTINVAASDSLLTTSGNTVYYGGNYSCWPMSYEKITKLELGRNTTLSHKEYLEKNAQLLTYLEDSGWVIKKVKISN